MKETRIAESKFTLEASRERLWDLIGMVILDSLPGVGRMEIIDELNWKALLKVKVWFIVLNMNLRGEIIEIIPPEKLSVRLTGRSKEGLLMNQTVRISLVSLGKDKTETTCVATGEGVGIFFRIFLLWKARRFARGIFESIERRLRQLA